MGRSCQLAHLTGPPGAPWGRVMAVRGWETGLGREKRLHPGIQKAAHQLGTCSPARRMCTCPRTRALQAAEPWRQREAPRCGCSARGVSHRRWARRPAVAHSLGEGEGDCTGGDAPGGEVTGEGDSTVCPRTPGGGTGEGGASLGEGGGGTGGEGAGGGGEDLGDGGGGLGLRAGRVGPFVEVQAGHAQRHSGICCCVLASHTAKRTVLLPSVHPVHLHWLASTHPLLPWRRRAGRRGAWRRRVGGWRAGARWRRRRCRAAARE